MTKNIAILMIVFPVLLFGQESKKVSITENNEKFYVLKSDKTTKHGEYKKFSFNNKLLVRGLYKKGLKDSIWDCYNLDGELNLKYDYTKSEVVFYKPSKTTKERTYKVVNPSSSADTILSSPPLFLEGDDYILSEIVKNINYPKSAQVNGISGKVYVLFLIDKNGKTSNYHVNKILGYGLDLEAIRVLKLLPDDWLPGLINTQPVDVEIVYPINFKLI